MCFRVSEKSFSDLFKLQTNFKSATRIWETNPFGPGLPFAHQDSLLALQVKDLPRSEYDLESDGHTVAAQSPIPSIHTTTDTSTPQSSTFQFILLPTLIASPISEWPGRTPATNLAKANWAWVRDINKNSNCQHTYLPDGCLAQQKPLLFKFET